MHAAQRPLSRVEGNAALHQLGIQLVAFKFFLAPASRKQTALVGFGLDVNLETALQLGFTKDHNKRKYACVAFSKSRGCLRPPSSAPWLRSRSRPGGGA